jgi:hypothetical protein
VRAIASLVIAASCGVLAFLAYDVYAVDRDQRKPVDAFAQKYTMTLRRPDVTTSLQYAPSADFAADLIADASLRDATMTVRLAGLTPEQRIAWLDAVGRLDEQLGSAADLALDAMTQRPGWPYHAGLLGQLVYTRDARALSPSIVTQSNRWSVPLRIASSVALNDELLWQFTALAYLQTWPELSEQHRDATPVFRRAFQDVDFVRATFSSATQIIGTDAAIDNLPESPKPLWAAFNQLANAGDIEHAWRVHQEWDVAEWKQRATDLAAIEKAAPKGDIGIVRALCETWTRNHSVWDYDSPAAHAQAARLLELWPVSATGKWSNDARADIIRYFISGRDDVVSGALLMRTAQAVTGVPEPTAAQLKVLASDIGGAQLIAKRSESFGSFEWKPYVYELSRYWLKKGDREKAQSTLATLATTAQGECEAVALQHSINDTHGTTSQHARVTWNSGRTNLTLCHQRRSNASLRLNLVDGPSAIVEIASNGARVISILVREGQPCEVGLPSAEGVRRISARILSSSDHATVILEASSDS